MSTSAPLFFEFYPNFPVGVERFLRHQSQPAHPCNACFPETQKLVKKKSPPNIKFFPMTTRRMAWLLAGVMEPDSSESFHRSAVGGGGEDEEGLENERATDSSGEESRSGYDIVAPAYPDTKMAAGEALAQNLATRKRAASFLHQLLVTVRRGGAQLLLLLPQRGDRYKNRFLGATRPWVGVVRIKLRK